ncbi:MAG: type III-B CRISPR-associated protein Cas10/Cmr2 [Cyanobacteria bacterium J06633_8]
MKNQRQRINTAIIWCLAWGELREPKKMLSQEVLQALRNGESVTNDVAELLEQVNQLQAIPEDDFPQTITELINKYGELWNQNNKIGLVYGGATKIKQYVFEAAKLPYIRGASAVLDRINLVDLPAFFGAEEDESFLQLKDAETKDYCQQVRDGWLNDKENFPGLSQALIPELIIYSTGGSILAFCPAAFVDDLANAIEKRYTHETLTANSCAVGDTFKLLELRFGLLSDSIQETFWLDKYLKNQNQVLVKAYFDQPGVNSPEQKFRDRKSFNELVLRLANQFSQRRNGNKFFANRSSRCYPPMFETHPYLHRDESDSHNAIVRVGDDENQNEGLPGEPWLSETLARKLLMGQITKREYKKGDLPKWWKNLGLDWKPGNVQGWVNRFENYRFDVPSRYYEGIENPQDVEEARSLREIASASTPSGFVAYIYADGNNMGGYIRQSIKTPEDYQRFSQDIFDATEKSVYAAIDKHLRPFLYTPDAKSSRNNKNPVLIHPFEIITIGGDDVLLVVPADKGLEIAKTIGEEFERRLLEESQGDYSLVSTKPIDASKAHRYHSKDNSEQAPVSKCKLSMSTGVLITACDTPIYYADKLVSQLLKSAKKTAKDLKKNHQYFSGTVDFLVMKAVTMISSNIKEFREQGLTKVSPDKPTLKLYSSPYTLYELGGLLKTVQAFKDTNFPRSQLYQIRSLLERGKRTAILNYRYFRIRLQDDNGKQLLEEQFEQPWCQAKTNNGNIAPWMSVEDENDAEKADSKTTYETIWRDIVDLYPFVPEKNHTDDSLSNQDAGREVG